MSVFSLVPIIHSDLMTIQVAVSSTTDQLPVHQVRPVKFRIPGILNVCQVQVTNASKTQYNTSSLSVGSGSGPGPATTLQTSVVPNPTPAPSPPSNPQPNPPSNPPTSGGKTKYAGVNIAGFDFGCQTDGTCTVSGVYPPLTQFSGKDG